MPEWNPAGGGAVPQCPVIHPSVCCCCAREDWDFCQGSAGQLCLEMSESSLHHHLWLWKWVLSPFPAVRDAPALPWQCLRWFLGFWGASVQVGVNRLNVSCSFALACAVHSAGSALSPQRGDKVVLSQPSAVAQSLMPLVCPWAVRASPGLAPA